MIHIFEWQLHVPVIIVIILIMTTVMHEEEIEETDLLVCPVMLNKMGDEYGKPEQLVEAGDAQQEQQERYAYAKFPHRSNIHL